MSPQSCCATKTMALLGTALDIADVILAVSAEIAQAIVLAVRGAAALTALKALPIVWADIAAFAIATLKAFAVVLADSLSAAVAAVIRLATVGALLILANCRHGLVPRARTLPVSSQYLYMCACWQTGMGDRSLSCCPKWGDSPEAQSIWRRLEWGGTPDREPGWVRQSVGKVPPRLCVAQIGRSSSRSGMCDPAASVHIHIHPRRTIFQHLCGARGVKKAELVTKLEELGETAPSLWTRDQVLLQIVSEDRGGGDPPDGAPELGSMPIAPTRRSTTTTPTM